MIPPRPPLRGKKIQAFLTDDDFDCLRVAAEVNGEQPGALASRALAQFIHGLRETFLPAQAERPQEGA